MLTMLPPAGPKYLSASREARSRPRTFRSNCLWKCSTVTSSSRQNSYRPALLTRMSSAPNARSASHEEPANVGLVRDVGLYGDRLPAAPGDPARDPLAVHGT